MPPWDSVRREARGLVADRLAWWSFRLRLWAHKLDGRGL